MSADETSITARINNETTLLNQEIKRLLDEFEKEKLQCEELSKSCLARGGLTDR